MIIHSDAAEATQQNDKEEQGEEASSENDKFFYILTLQRVCLTLTPDLQTSLEKIHSDLWSDQPKMEV